jgi:hypothetical protein
MRRRSCSGRLREFIHKVSMGGCPEGSFATELGNPYFITHGVSKNIKGYQRILLSCFLLWGSSSAICRISQRRPSISVMSRRPELTAWTCSCRFRIARRSGPRSVCRCQTHNPGSWDILSILVTTGVRYRSRSSNSASLRLTVSNFERSLIIPISSPLGFRIKGRCRFIQNQDAWVV